ncbi:MAG: thiamine pyrophosphate-binding protein [Hyphomicrobiaceae bacterium]|nr:thiamine pyrophosphate-binding protein [Hyphomicrobiaceae bacterium]
MRTGGQILVDHLALNGIGRIFMVPGESFLPALDALHDTPSIDVVVCRHEGGAAMMAEATSRLALAGVGGDGTNGVIGAAFVTRGPGLANAMSGLHVAMQAGTPLLLLVGLPPSGHEGRGAFQELPPEPFAGHAVKWAATVRDAARIPEFVNRAIVTARSGTAGPVILGLPEDVLAAAAEVANAPPTRIASAGPSWSDLAQIAAALERAEWPIVIAGGPGWTPATRAELARFAERFDLPVVASFRSQDVIDNRSPQYVGHAGIGMCPKLTAAIARADLLIAIGTRLDEVTAGRYELLTPPTPRQRALVHVHPDPAALGVNLQATVPVVSSIAAFAASLDDITPSVRRGALHSWSTLRRDLRAAFESWQSFSAMPASSTQIATSPSTVRFESVVRHLSDVLPPDAVICNGAGNYAAFVHRAFTYKDAGTQLAPVSGSMGYGLPAAIAAKLAAPERDVICFAGDGCFQMTSPELATAVQYGLGIVVVIANNGLLGTIRAEQERRYPGRRIATSLVNPDFAALARSHGAFGERITRDNEIAGAIARARAARRPAILDIAVDPDAIAPGVSLSGLTSAALSDAD